MKLKWYFFNDFIFVESLQLFSTEILLRSQKRLEQGLHDHHEHTDELDKIRERAHLPQSNRRGRNSWFFGSLCKKGLIWQGSN